MAKVKHPVVLLVLDGWGHSDSMQHNAIAAASTPRWDALWAEQPRTLIDCSGTVVGLPAGQMGNSEVGHMHIGAGRLIDQDFLRIGKAIEQGAFNANAALRSACEQAAARGRSVHILGLASPGGVHSHEDHILALIDLARECGVTQILIHAFLDGRDTPPRSARATLERIERHARATGHARIASIVGRYYAMDRNQNWDRVERAYHLLVEGRAQHHAGDPVAALEAAYARDESDEFVDTAVITDHDGSRHSMGAGDVVLFANFRADRARQITTALTAPEFEGFPRGAPPALGAFVCMTDYGQQFDLPVAYPAFDLPNTFGDILAARGLTQLRIAETEKYAHVTFFFNGGEEKQFPGEERILVPSPDVATYDLKPEMSAAQVTERLCEAIRSRRFDAIICNYANADMVGHTGDFDATVRCIEALDACIGEVIDCAAGAGAEVLITADHGNAEKMRASNAEDSAPHTAHTSNLVPLVYVGRDATIAEGGNLADLAPTMLRLLDLAQPAEMTGRPLVLTGDSSQDAA